VPRGAQQRTRRCSRTRRRESPVGDLSNERTIARPAAVAGSTNVFHLRGALVSTGDGPRDRPERVAGKRGSIASTRRSGGVGPALHPSARPDVYGYPGGEARDRREACPARAFANWYRAGQGPRAESEVPAHFSKHAIGSRRRVLSRRRSTGRAPRGRASGGDRRRAIRATNMASSTGGRGRRGLCYVRQTWLDAACAGPLRTRAGRRSGVQNVSGRGWPVTWGEFTDAIDDAYGCAKVRWEASPIGWRRPSASRSSTALTLIRPHGIGLATRPPRLRAHRRPPTCSPKDQDFSKAARAREVARRGAPTADYPRLQANGETGWRAELPQGTG